MQLRFAHCRLMTFFLSQKEQYMTWLRGMSRMSGILIFSYRLKEVTNSYVLNYFELHGWNRSYLRNHVFDWDGVWIKMWHFRWTSDLFWKNQNCILPTCDHFPLIVSHMLSPILTGLDDIPSLPMLKKHKVLSLDLVLIYANMLIMLPFVFTGWCCSYRVSHVSQNKYCLVFKVDLLQLVIWSEVRCL